MTKRLVILLLAIIGAVAGITPPVSAAMPVPPKPANGWYVLDQTHTLSNDETQKLNAQIEGYRKKSGVQFAVLMVPTITSDDYLERFSLNVARGWGVGEKSKNNGALLLVVKNDRKLRIEVGYGLEGDLTDSRAARIINDRIAPEFRKGKYYDGILAGLQGMALAVDSQADPVLASEESPQQAGWWQLIFFVLIFAWTILSWLAAILGRTKRWWPGGIVGGSTGGILAFLAGGVTWAIAAGIFGILFGFIFDYFVSKNYQKAKVSGHEPSWWAGGGSFGGGGGFSGGGGFGGGGFGGGGSSGSW